MLAVRFLLWLFGLALTTVPLIAAVTVRPSNFASVFEVGSYTSFYPELTFMCVAIGAVAVAESVELLIDLDRATEIVKVCVAVPCFLALLLIVILSGIWYGQFLGQHGAGGSVPVSDIQYVLVLLAAVVFGAFVLKLLLWARP